MNFLWFLSSYRSPILDKVMQLITYFGQDLLIIVAICTLYWCIDKKFAYLVGFNYFVSGLLIQTLKITFRIPRPWILDPNFKPVTSALSGATGYSFPSGHTQGATSFFFTLSLSSKKRVVKIVSVITFLLVGFSRMYLGAHTPKDVLVAMAVSLLVAGFLWQIKDVLLDSKNIFLIALLLIITALMVLTYGVFLIQNAQVDLANGLDAIKAAGAGVGFSIGFILERKYVNFKEQGLPFSQQLLKLIVGLLGAFLLKTLFSFLLGKTVVGAALEYFFLVLWVIYLYPLIFENFLKLKDR